MPTPNRAMRAEAKRGLDWREEFNRGGTEVGVARARDIVNNRNLSINTVQRMASYFARHEVDKQGKGWSPGGDGYPSAGRIAWALWCGDAGRSWANKILEEEDRMIARAEPGALSVGDYVSWDSSGGSVYGRIRRIVTDGTLNVPDTDFSINATEDDPAALIMVYRELEDGWAPSGTLVGHKFSTLTKVSARAKDPEQQRHIKKITETEDQIIIVFGKSDEYQEMEEPDENAYKKDKDKKKYREQRPAQKLEIRDADDGNVTVEGYAAVFNQETVIGGQWREEISPGAFRSAVGRDDVVFLINHQGLPLARTRSGTLELSEDDHGLRIRAELDPSDPDVRAIVPKMKRGDLDRMSFAFIPTRQSWSDEEKMPRRTIEEAELFDVSIVTTPAYEGTSIGLRSALESLERHRKRHRKGQAARRLRMKVRQSLNSKGVSHVRD